MDYGLIALVVGTILSVASIVFSQKYTQVKTKLRIFTEIMDETIHAVEDNKLTEEELGRISSLIKKLLEKGE